MAVDNKQIATDVLELVGGAENVSVATNCMTRLRLTLKDNSKADVEKIKKVKGVLGCQFAGSQLHHTFASRTVSTVSIIPVDLRF